MFRVDTKTDKEIVFTATAYFAGDTYLENYFFTTPANPSAFTTKEFTYKMEYTEKGWRFSQYPFMRG